MDEDRRRRRCAEPPARRLHRRRAGRPPPRRGIRRTGPRRCRQPAGVGEARSGPADDRPTVPRPTWFEATQPIDQGDRMSCRAVATTVNVPVGDVQPHHRVGQVTVGRHRRRPRTVVTRQGQEVGHTPTCDQRAADVDRALDERRHRHDQYCGVAEDRDQVPDRDRSLDGQSGGQPHDDGPRTASATPDRRLGSHWSRGRPGNPDAAAPATPDGTGPHRRPCRPTRSAPAEPPMMSTMRPVKTGLPAAVGLAHVLQQAHHRSQDQHQHRHPRRGPPRPATRRPGTAAPRSSRTPTRLRPPDRSR